MWREILAWRRRGRQAGEGTWRRQCAFPHWAGPLPGPNKTGDLFANTHHSQSQVLQVSPLAWPQSGAVNIWEEGNRVLFAIDRYEGNSALEW